MRTAMFPPRQRPILPWALLFSDHHLMRPRPTDKAWDARFGACWQASEVSVTTASVADSRGPSSLLTAASHRRGCGPSGARLKRALRWTATPIGGAENRDCHVKERAKRSLRFSVTTGLPVPLQVIAGAVPALLDPFQGVLDEASGQHISQRPIRTTPPTPPSREAAFSSSWRSPFSGWDRGPQVGK